MVFCSTFLSRCVSYHCVYVLYSTPTIGVCHIKVFLFYTLLYISVFHIIKFMFYTLLQVCFTFQCFFSILYSRCVLHSSVFVLCSPLGVFYIIVFCSILYSTQVCLISLSLCSVLYSRCVLHSSVYFLYSTHIIEFIFYTLVQVCFTSLCLRSILYYRCVSHQSVFVLYSTLHICVSHY